MEEAFFEGRRSASVPFVINDSVDVVGGPHAGRGGAVIAVLAIEPELEVCVELSDGTDIHLVAKDIRLVNDAG